MKPGLLIAALPIALVIGFFAGRTSSPQADSAAVAKNDEPTRTRNIRTTREDPFGGASFSLHSLEEVSELFKKQRYNIASARLTLAVDSLPASEIPKIMEMLQDDFRKNPNPNDQSRYQFFSAVAAKWADIDPDAALAFIHTSPYRSFRNMASRTVFSGLAESDANRAISEMQSLPKGEMREQATSSIVEAIGKSDPEAAINLLESEPSRSRWGNYYLRTILADWAKKDPAAAAARATSLPGELVGEYGMGGIANAWSQSDPDAALTWAKTLSGASRSSAFKEIYNTLAREDPQAAWERIRTEPGHLRGQLSATVLTAVADEDPKKAVALLMGMTSPSEKRIAAGNLIDQLDWNDPRLGFEILEQLDDPVIRRERLPNLLYSASWTSRDFFKEQTAKLSERDKLLASEYMLGDMARSDPKAAQEFFLSLPEAQRKPGALQQMMANQSSKDTSGALSFALSLDNPQEQISALNGLFSRWGADDPEAAAANLKKLPEGEGRLGALNTIATSWARRDPEAALQWAETLSGNERARALAAVLPAMGKDDPVTASRQLSALIASPPDGMASNLATSAGTLASTWAADNPSEAATWSASLPEGEGKNQSTGAVARSWASYDAVAAANWIGTLAAGESRDSAVKSLVGQVVQTDPGTAFLWAASIGETDDRTQQLQSTLQAWKRTDLNAARAALESSNLSAAEKAKLQKQLD